MKHLSPLRYPGGKASLAYFVKKTIELNRMEGCVYYEPYAGGAGVALELLKNKIVSKIVINDADIRIYAIWKSIFDDTEKFINTISNIPLTIEEWRKQRAICDKPTGYTLFDVGFSAFYMNRCNRSGILLKAGPIGGMGQSGQWKIDARFNRENLIKRVMELSKMRERIDLFNLDAIEFLKTTLPKGKGRVRTFVYLDPPYVNKADKLYMNNYQEKDHRKIAKYLKSQKKLHWLLSYDDTKLVRDLYKKYRIFHLPIRYSLQSKKLSQELIVASDDLLVPIETNELQKEVL